MCGVCFEGRVRATSGRSAGVRSVLPAHPRIHRVAELDHPLVSSRVRSGRVWSVALDVGLSASAERGRRASRGSPRAEDAVSAPTYLVAHGVIRVCAEPGQARSVGRVGLSARAESGRAALGAGMGEAGYPRARRGASVVSALGLSARAEGANQVARFRAHTGSSARTRGAWIARVRRKRWSGLSARGAGVYGEPYCLLAAPRFDLCPEDGPSRPRAGFRAVLLHHRQHFGLRRFFVVQPPRVPLDSR